MDTAGLRYLRTLYRVGVVGDLTDGQLLERFVAGRDEAAEAGFAALVERHGPMVLRVCRQILGDAHDAEDAFQATFLVLARRAGLVRKRESVASWLYGIAHRVAKRSQADSARRREHERQRAALTTMELSHYTTLHTSEEWPALHDEIGRVPARYREAIVLCYLEGLTTEAAARRLACAQGTIMSRLSRGRDRLRKRLTRRGLAPAAGLLTAGMAADGAEAAVPTALAHSLVRAAMQMAAGTTAAGAVPATVAALTDGALKHDDPFQAQRNPGSSPGCRYTRRRDGDVRLSDGRSPAAGCTGGQDHSGGTDRVAEGRRATNSESTGRRACRPGRRYVASGRGRAVHGHRCHRPTDGEVADDLHGARHRRWPRLSRRPIPRLRDHWPEPRPARGRNLGL